MGFSGSPVAGRISINLNIPVFLPYSFLITVHLEFNRIYPDGDAFPAIGADHIVDDVAVAAITGRQVSVHDEIRHGVKQGLVVNGLERQAVGALDG